MISSRSLSTLIVELPILKEGSPDHSDSNPPSLTKSKWEKFGPIFSLFWNGKIINSPIVNSQLLWKRHHKSLTNGGELLLCLLYLSFYLEERNICQGLRGEDLLFHPFPILNHLTCLSPKLERASVASGEFILPFFKFSKVEESQARLLTFDSVSPTKKSFQCLRMSCLPLRGLLFHALSHT